MTIIIDEIEALVEKLFDEPGNPLDLFARMFGLSHYERSGPKRYRIFDGVDEPYACRFCECDDLWTERGGVWYCDHRGSEFAELLPMAAAEDTREMSEVSRWEEI